MLLCSATNLKMATEDFTGALVLLGRYSLKWTRETRKCSVQTKSSFSTLTRRSQSKLRPW